MQAYLKNPGKIQDDKGYVNTYEFPEQMLHSVNLHLIIRREMCDL